MSKFVLIDLHPIPYDIISKEEAEKQGCVIDEITSKLVSDYPEYNEGIIFEYKDTKSPERDEERNPTPNAIKTETM